MSVTFEEARARAASVGYQMVDDEVREAERWWYFAVAQIGCRGIVVDKHDGAVTEIGSRGDLDDWLWAHDAGVVCGDASLVDFIVEEFANRDEAIKLVRALGIHTNNWRKIRDALDTLPARFRRVPLWMSIRELRTIDRSILRWRVEPSSTP